MNVSVGPVNMIASPLSRATSDHVPYDRFFINMSCSVVMYSDRPQRYMVKVGNGYVIVFACERERKCREEVIRKR